MKIFFDNCTTPVLASALNGFVAHLGHRAHHIADFTDLPRGRRTGDIEWIELLSKDKLVWMVVTGDGRILRNKAERAAFRAAGLSGFVLAPAYQKTPVNQVASFLLWRWPEMEQLFGLVTGPALFKPLASLRSSLPCCCRAAIRRGRPWRARFREHGRAENRRAIRRPPLDCR